jgi:hypothetical protein
MAWPNEEQGIYILSVNETERLALFTLIARCVHRKGG